MISYTALQIVCQSSMNSVIACKIFYCLVCNSDLCLMRFVVLHGQRYGGLLFLIACNDIFCSSHLHIKIDVAIVHELSAGQLKSKFAS